MPESVKNSINSISASENDETDSRDSARSLLFNNVHSIASKITYSRVLVADLQILSAALLFGLGFIGQREVSVEGLGPMTCNVIIKSIT
jgi:hypothetical protein